MLVAFSALGMLLNVAAYLFICPPTCDERHGALVIQMT